MIHAWEEAVFPGPFMPKSHHCLPQWSPLKVPLRPAAPAVDPALACCIFLDDNDQGPRRL